VNSRSGRKVQTKKKKVGSGKLMDAHCGRAAAEGEQINKAFIQMVFGDEDESNIYYHNQYK
jgi:hypothetical protein